MEVHNPNSPNVSRSAASSSERDSASPAPERSTSPSSSSGRSPASPDVPRCDTPSPESSGHDAQSLLELIAEKDRRLEAHETWLKLELRQSGHLFWEYDLATNRLRVLSHEPPLGVRETIIEDFPESAIANGDVHIDSFAPLRALTANMHAGVPEGGGTFFIADRQNGGYAWSSTSYRLVNDADGTPCRAIGVREDKPVRASGTLSSKEHEPVPVNILMHLFCYVQYCVSTNNIDFMLLQGTDQTGAYQESSYEELIEWFAAMLYTEQEKDRFRQQAARARLVAEYRAGRRWSAERYRIVDENGIVRNMFFAVNMRRSAKTGNLLFLIYLSGIEARARWEAKASVGCVREQDTNLYPSSIASGIAQAVSSEASELSRSAIVLFSLQGLAALEERDRTAASNLRHDIALALGAFLDSDSILYTCGDDAIVAVLPEVKSQLEARQRIELAVNSARSSMEDERGMHDVKIVAVAVCGKTLNLDLEAHVARAQRACEEHGRAAADAVIVRCGEQDERADSPREVEALTVRTTEDELDAETAREYVDCLEAILHEDSAGAAVNTVLARLGDHYRADRVYVLSVRNADKLVSILFEWSHRVDARIQRPFTGMSLERFPLIMRYLSTDAPVLVSRPASAPGLLYGSDEEGWNYAIVPVSRATDRTTVLCLENPHDNLSRWAFAERLAPHIHHNWQLLARTPSHSQPPFGSVSHEPNEFAFERDAERIESERCSSLGAVVMDIPNVERLVKRKGLSYAMSVATSLENAAREVFGSEHLFHTRDTELSIFVPNVTYEAFIKLCARVRTRLAAECGGNHRLGTSWTSDATNALRLAMDARYIKDRYDGEQPAFNDAVRSATPLPTDGSRDVPLPALASALSDVGDRFDVYLQPKVDMRTGALVGAEALARVVDAAGNAITPTAAIERMEQSGDIRELDYFVFDRALALMNEWREKGLTIVPLSSNFSRSTIASSSALASVLAIMSRYPDIEPGLMEMEVTETAGDLGQTTLARLVGTFRDMGLRVALDDFGAHYSNASMLANAEFDAVKLDRALVNDVTSNDTVRTLVRSIVDVCNHRQMDCIAEGIENLDQARSLIDEGCYLCQGFYYDRPLPAEVFERKYLLGTAAG